MGAALLHRTCPKQTAVLAWGPPTADRACTRLPADAARSWVLWAMPEGMGGIVTDSWDW